MLNEHRLALHGVYERGCLVAVLEVRAVLTRQFLHHPRAVVGLGVHCHQILHAVAAMNVQHLAVGAYAVRRIDVATVLGVVVQPPVVPVGRPEVVEVVQVGPLHVQHLAEESLLRHVQRSQFEEVVDAVLEHHAMLAGALAGVDELPYLVHIEGCGHLDGHVLAVLHRVDRQRHMVYPVGGDVDEVNVVAQAHFLVCLRRAAVGRCTLPPVSF